MTDMPPNTKFMNHSYFSQLRHASEMDESIRRELLEKGYVNTIHDVWEKPEQ